MDPLLIANLLTGSCLTVKFVWHLQKSVHGETDCFTLGTTTCSVNSSRLPACQYLYFSAVYTASQRIVRISATGNRTIIDKLVGL
jgi:hypothetical protein